MSRAQTYYLEVRAQSKQCFDAINALVALQREFNALDYGSTLPDGTGDNAGLTKTQLGAVVFDTANAFVTVLNAGNATNMAKLL